MDSASSVPPWRVIVTGATGKTGTEVVRLLLEQTLLIPVLAGPTAVASAREVHVALAVRSLERGAASLKRTVDAICAALDAEAADRVRALALTRTSCVQYVQEQAATHAGAVAGAHALYAIVPKPGPWSVAQVRPLWAAAVAARVSHVTFLSNAANEISDRAPHAAMERDLKAACSAAGAATTWTMLRAEYFMQNLLRDNAHCIDIRERSELYAPAGTARIPWVDDRDVAAAAVVTLLNPAPHASRCYLLTGPELLTYGQAAAALSAALGRPVPYREAWSAGYAARKIGQGVPLDFVVVQLLVFAAVRSGAGARLTGTLAELLAALPLPPPHPAAAAAAAAPAGAQGPVRAPRTLAAFAADYAAQGVWAPRGKLSVDAFD